MGWRRSSRRRAAGSGLGYMVNEYGAIAATLPFRILHTLKEDAQSIKEQVLPTKA